MIAKTTSDSPIATRLQRESLADDHDRLLRRREARERGIGGDRSHSQLAYFDWTVAAIPLDAVGLAVPPRLIDETRRERRLVVLDGQDVVPPFSTTASAVAVCVCIASRVTVTSSKSSSARIARAAGISLLLSATCCCATTTPSR